VDIPENEKKCHLNKTTDSGGEGGGEGELYLITEIQDFTPICFRVLIKIRNPKIG
jgi:hypothetical protein